MSRFSVCTVFDPRTLDTFYVPISATQSQRKYNFELVSFRRLFENSSKTRSAPVFFTETNCFYPRVHRETSFHGQLA